MVAVAFRNESQYKGLYSAQSLKALARRICAGEKRSGELELSVLFCDDPFIQELNHQYRAKNKATDVLAFPQPPPVGEGPVALGDIVISLETVVGRNEDQDAARSDVRLIFCHGLLHLLGYDHDTKASQQDMVARQAHYLGCSLEAAWQYGRGAAAPGQHKQEA